MSETIAAFKRERRHRESNLFDKLILPSIYLTEISPHKWIRVIGQALTIPLLPWTFIVCIGGVVCAIVFFIALAIHVAVENLKNYWEEI